MANVKKGQTVKSPQWWKHLRDWKRVFWGRQRMSDHEMELEVLRDLPDDEIDLSDAPEVTNWSGATRGRFLKESK